MVKARLWSDYLCPWCYVGQDRSALMEDLGVELTRSPYELHPDIGPEGRRPRPGGRLDAVHARIEDECAAVGLPFRRPTRIPSTRRALEMAEVVRTAHPLAFAALDAALFRAHFVDGAPLDDADLLDQLVTESGAPAVEVRAALDAGVGAALLDRSMAEARDAGVASTPTWLLGDFLIPGLQPRDTVERWVSRLLASRREPTEA